MDIQKNLEMNVKRNTPIESKIITKVYMAVKKETGDSELALTVSTQLRQFARLVYLEKEMHKQNMKTIPEKLREIADTIADF